MHPPKLFATALGLLFVLLAASPRSRAYEDDVHFGLTKWLALQADFDPAQAETIADYTVWLDHSLFRATYMVPWYACIWRDVEGSRAIQRVHFPGDGLLPAEAKNRPVFPGSKEALRLIRSEIDEPAKFLGVGLGNFGNGLHPFQDSWSHQGIPGTPLAPLCNSELSWGHPASRGGWRSHDADVTYKYPGDALVMARATFERLCEYADVVVKRKCARDFERDLSTEVRAFISASTKAEKRTWFLAKGFTKKETRFLKHTSLPRGDRSSPVDEERIGRPSNPEALDKSEEAGFMLAFFSQWLTTSDENRLIQSMIDVEQFHYATGPTPRFKPMDPGLVALLLTLWRVRDHGDAAQALHSPEPPSKDALLTALNQTKDINLPYKAVEEALLPLDESGVPMVLKVFELDGEQYLAAFVRLRHAPYEILTVYAKRKAGRYWIIGIDSAVDQ